MLEARLLEKALETDEFDDKSLARSDRDNRPAMEDSDLFFMFCGATTIFFCYGNEKPLNGHTGKYDVRRILEGGKRTRSFVFSKEVDHT